MTPPDPRIDPLSAWPDAALASEARAGSSACFEELVRRFQVPLLRYVQRSLRRHDAEDVVQDAFVQAYLHLPKYDARWAFKTWLFVIAQRLTIDRLRRRKPQSIGERDMAAPAAADVLDDAEAAGQLWATARATLKDEAFRALWLYYVEDLPAADVARVLGRSWVWVKTTLHRARKQLKSHVTEDGERRQRARLSPSPITDRA